MEEGRPVKGIDIEAQLKEWEEKYGHDEKITKTRKHPASKLDDIAKLPAVHKKGTQASAKGDFHGVGGIYSF